MKKLYLKGGEYFNVKIKFFEAAHIRNNVKEMELYDYNDDVICWFELIKDKLVIKTKARVLQFYEVQVVAEIAENFNQYFNNLNQ